MLAVEQLVVDSLRKWLLRNLPAKVAEVNTQRAAVLMTPGVEPFTVPAGAKLFYSATEFEPTSWTEISPFTSGSRTAKNIAADINSVVPGLASDADGYLVLTAAAPVGGTDSLVVLGPDSTGMMAALGFDAGGERAMRTVLVAPGLKGVADGAPIIPDLGSGFWIIFGDNVSMPLTPAVRRDENVVSVAVSIGVPVPSAMYRDREHVRAALRCVREILFLTPSGRTLGNTPGIQLVEEKQGLVKSRPVALAEFPNQLFSRVLLELQVRVFERQAD